MRPIPTAALSWPLHPVPLRVPLALRPDFALCGGGGVMSPEEVPSPPGTSVADMPSSPLLGVRSPGVDQLQGFPEGGLLVDVNNNAAGAMSSSSSGGEMVGCYGEDMLKGGGRSQSFKNFLEVCC